MNCEQGQYKCSLRRAEAQAAAHHHDMRHHLTAVDGFLTAGDPGHAQDHIKRARADIDKIVPKRFCENELVNLLCPSFSAKAERMGARFKVDATIPEALPVSDTAGGGIFTLRAALPM